MHDAEEAVVAEGAVAAERAGVPARPDDPVAIVADRGHSGSVELLPSQCERA